MTTSRQSDRRDRACLRRLARGDADALDELYRRHATTAWRHAQWVTRSAADADDVVQTVFVRLAAAGSELPGIKRFRAYLGAMVHHEAIAVAHRRNERRADLPAPTDRLLATDATADLAAERATLSRLVAALPAEQREVVLLRAYGGFGFREIGRAVGVSTFTAATRWRLAIARLRRSITEERE